jgi:hypothetical protein
MTDQQLEAKFTDLAEAVLPDAAGPQADRDLLVGGETGQCGGYRQGSGGVASKRHGTAQTLNLWEGACSRELTYIH